jgi:hypothetical protein
MNYSKLAKERDALGGISPELVKGQEGAGKTDGEGSCQKSAGVSTRRLTTSLSHSRRRNQIHKSCESVLHPSLRCHKFITPP